MVYAGTTCQLADLLLRLLFKHAFEVCWRQGQCEQGCSLFCSAASSTEV
jgi:hypothetical protein